MAPQQEDHILAPLEANLNKQVQLTSELFNLVLPEFNGVYMPEVVI